MGNPLTLTLRFPLGQFNAANGTGAAEYPPSPARVASALLAVSHGAGNEDEIAAARALFDTLPPVIDAPDAYATDRMERWVPVQFDHKARKQSLMPKAGENGVMLDASIPLSYYWEDFEGDVEALHSAALRVTYVGRPTGPAVLSAQVSDIPKKPVAGAYRWVSADHGDASINVASKDYLRVLDNAHSEREALGNPGYHPPVRRTVAKYITPVIISDQDGNIPFAPAWAEVESFLSGSAVYRIPACDLGYADMALDIVRLSTGTDNVVPVLRDAEHGGNQLYGVIATGAALTGVQSIPVMTGSGVADAVRTGIFRASEKKATIRALSTARVWTTVIPVSSDESDVINGVEALAASLGAEIESLQGHNTARDESYLASPERDDLVHLSIRFDRPVTGPLFITSGDLTSVLFPVTITNED